jgi:hypothetical protein
MSKPMILASAVLIGASLLSGPVLSQGAPQEIAKVDLRSIDTAYRGSKVIGSTVYNDQNETVGKIDDVLISADGKAPYAVLSVGGFLGMGNRLIVVPTSNLKVAYDNDKSDHNKIVLPGATKDHLKGLPEYTYSKK